MDSDAPQAFIDRWRESGGAERANYQSFLIELCDLLGVEHPHPATADGLQNAYVFEKAIAFDNRDGTRTTKYADLYKRGAFVCETKQGVERDEAEAPLSEKQRARIAKRKAGHGTRGSKAYDDALRRAHGQAESYARNLPAEEGRPRRPRTRGHIASGCRNLANADVRERLRLYRRRQFDSNLADNWAFWATSQRLLSHADFEFSPLEHPPYSSMQLHEVMVPSGWQCAHGLDGSDDARRLRGE